LKAKIDYDVDKAGKNAILVRLTAPPTVDVSVKIDPVDALPVTGVKLVHRSKKTVWDLPGPPLDPHPFAGQVLAGTYNLSWRIVGAPPEHPDWVDDELTVDISPVKNCVTVLVGGVGS
jgi:hypothetical protein